MDRKLEHQLKWHKDSLNKQFKKDFKHQLLI
jgi:hypothetical protein